jgi:hypothetical protein
MRVQELAARIKEAGWPGDAVRFAATLVDEITDPTHGVATAEQVGHESALLRAELAHESALLRGELAHESALLRGEIEREAASLRGQIEREAALLRDEIRLVREEMRAMETRLELRIERGLRQWGLLIVAMMGVIGTLLALLR